MNTTEFAAAVNWTVKNLAGRLNALGLLDTCTRCGGGGRYSFCQMYGDTCFGCRGSGKGLPKLTKTLVKTVQEKVAAGGLDAYLALCKAKNEARAQIKPLVAAALAAYGVIGDAYSIEHDAKRNIMGCPMNPHIVNAQHMNNDLFYGSHYGSHYGNSTKKTPAMMSVCEIESALKYNEVSSLVAVEIIRERVAQLEALRDAFVGSVAVAA